MGLTKLAEAPSRTGQRSLFRDRSALFNPRFGEARAIKGRKTRRRSPHSPPPLPDDNEVRRKDMARHMCLDALVRTSKCIMYNDIVRQIPSAPSLAPSTAQTGSPMSCIFKIEIAKYPGLTAPESGGLLEKPAASWEAHSLLGSTHPFRNRAAFFQDLQGPVATANGPLNNSSEPTLTPCAQHVHRTTEHATKGQP